ncbi:YcaO-like family protein [Nocardiopsis salina]|uniref:YcaO-like family protein n=1 Tax=Nocardiopsis salina TaxID=245836 RepID=UPI000360BEF0|nr:YcaO-like family protein [Nocardiopsis salina]
MARPSWVRLSGGPAPEVRSPVATPDLWSGSQEREFTLSEAQARILADIDELGWSSQFRLLDGSDPTAAQCALWDAQGAEIPYGLGAGKGPCVPARIGAQFEAMEHVFTGPFVLDSLPVRLLEAAQLKEGPYAGDRAIGDVGGQAGRRVACLPYRSLDGGVDFDVPLYLWAPWYSAPAPEAVSMRRGLGDTVDYGSALAFSVNSGCAIGASEDEALLHALNEWVERDAFSLFLLRSIYDGGPMPAHVPRTDLPAALRSHLDRAEELTAGAVALLDLTSDLGVPVVMAYAHGPSGSKHRYGLGASLSGTLAAERAITEFVQDELLSRVVAEHAGSEGRTGPYAQLMADHDIRHDVDTRFREHPRLLACAQLDFMQRLEGSPRGPLPAEAVPKGTPVSDQREAVVERIAAAGHRVGAHALRRSQRGTTVVQVQCPGLERFHLVTEGHLALPGKRGRRWRYRGSAPL